MQREELSQLLCEKVLAGADGGHLSSDGVHVLTQGNTFLLRLVPIGIKMGGERMNMVFQGLSRTVRDLSVTIHGVACTGYGCWDITLGLIILSGLPNFALGSGIGRRCCTYSSESNIETLAI